MYSTLHGRHFHFTSCHLRSEEEQPLPERTKEKVRKLVSCGSSSARRSKMREKVLGLASADTPTGPRQAGTRTLHNSKFGGVHGGTVVWLLSLLRISTVLQSPILQKHVSSLSKDGERHVSFGQSPWTDEETPPPPAGVSVANCSAKKAQRKFGCSVRNMYNHRSHHARWIASQPGQPAFQRAQPASRATLLATSESRACPKAPSGRMRKPYSASRPHMLPKRRQMLLHVVHLNFAVAFRWVDEARS